jgi:DDE family transposase
MVVVRRGVVLDMDSSVSPTHGEQEMSVWNGHYECTCYHSLFVFNQFGDLERCTLRPGNVHSADGWRACSSQLSNDTGGRSRAFISGLTRVLPLLMQSCLFEAKSYNLVPKNQ